MVYYRIASEIVVYQFPQVVSQSCVVGYGECYCQKGHEGHRREEAQSHGLLSYVLVTEILGGQYDDPDIPDDLGLCLSAHRIHQFLGEVAYLVEIGLIGPSEEFHGISGYGHFGLLRKLSEGLCSGSVPA